MIKFVDDLRKYSIIIHTTDYISAKDSLFILEEKSLTDSIN